MKKSAEMKNKIETLKNEGQQLIDNGDIEGAKAKIQELKNAKAALDMQLVLESDEYNILKDDVKKNIGVKSVKEGASIIRACIKKVTGKNLSEAENSLLIPSAIGEEGTNGEGYLIPEDIRTLITQKIRDYSSMRDVVGSMTVSTMSGSFPVEDFDTVTELVDFTEQGDDMKEVTAPKFKQVKYTLSIKAGFIGISNTLLGLTDNDLVAYIVAYFSKKAAVTENKMIVTALETGKTAKALADWKDLKSSINVDIDPAAAVGMEIITNQTGFNVLDQALDTIGRPVLQPDPTSATLKRFMGIPVKVFSDKILANGTGVAPIFYGNLKEGVYFVSYNGMSIDTSKEAGFLKNLTYMRIIEYITAVQVDGSDECYIYGQLATA
ncbi:MAG: phage major capsid protein [Clostridia bacterium]|jgi:HK97 family phage major capsid protein|nr:phage major capsid protein [Clostridia bacterium]